MNRPTIVDKEIREMKKQLKKERKLERKLNFNGEEVQNFVLEASADEIQFDVEQRILLASEGMLKYSDSYNFGYYLPKGSLQTAAKEMGTDTVYVNVGHTSYISNPILGSLSSFGASDLDYETDERGFGKLYLNLKLNSDMTLVKMLKETSDNLKTPMNLSIEILPTDTMNKTITVDGEEEYIVVLEKYDILGAGVVGLPGNTENILDENQLQMEVDMAGKAKKVNADAEEAAVEELEKVLDKTEDTTTNEEVEVNEDSEAVADETTEEATEEKEEVADETSEDETEEDEEDEKEQIESAADVIASIQKESQPLQAQLDAATDKVTALEASNVKLEASSKAYKEKAEALEAHLRDISSDNTVEEDDGTEEVKEVEASRVDSIAAEMNQIAAESA